MDRNYCTVKEIIDDLGMNGTPSEAGLMKHVRAASQFIEQTLGQFLPVVETRRFSGFPAGAPGAAAAELLVPPLLSVTRITNGGTALTASDYILAPDGRHWKNGPYSSLVIAESGSAGSWSTLQQGVVIEGEWGLYDETLDLGVNITSGNATDTSLSVADGSKCSAGMVMLVVDTPAGAAGPEQMLVEATGVATDSTATLGAGCTADDEELTLSDGSKVKAGEVIRVGFEQMKVLEVQTNAVLVGRGWNGSRRAAHLSAAAVYVFRTFTVKRGVNGTTAAAHASAAAYQVVAPADVNYLCRQIASLMIKKAETGFVGRSGNDELGTGFWVNEFPKNQIESVRSNYFWGGR
jgi:hypothetical protein